MNIGIYVYEHAEVLDFAGPFEVFSTAKRLGADSWQVGLIAEQDSPLLARGGLRVVPDYHLANHPTLDVLLVVGGVHHEQVTNPSVIDWVKQQDAITQCTASVCTGAFILAEAGLLNGRKVITHWEDMDDLSRAYPPLSVVSGKRWVRDGKYLTSAGISAGIDMSLQLVADLHSEDLALRVAKQMDYHWQRNE
ncbi:glutamine amidotransferase [Salinivibrio sp. IB868]|uniref:DJ-1/PfpI family protein n=1 Tax=unclassified Salinivibrio TaxID=2636825 RepID=UPI00098791B3|nr:MULTISPECIES: DJ-1/PfpI family protein [unclassified Salinivibrio]OOE65909.1 glutamine amidotransferase [Salinivibrio sp. IB868]OOE72141.1 glutamine amidotransferase [Salinivibrio sp. IB870]